MAQDDIQWQKLLNRPSGPIKRWEFLDWVSCLGKNKNRGHVSGGNLKPGMTVLSKSAAI
jgi:hypothetical protein